MNNYFYTWRGGDLYRHNSNIEDRNTFYSQWWIKDGNPSGAFTPSSLQSVINTVNLENKIFKTIDLQGDDVWDMQLSTDLQVSGYILGSWFEKKESTYFAFIRNNDIGQLPQRSVNGIGSGYLAGTSPTYQQINFDFDIGTIASVGDYMYYYIPPNYTNKYLLGVITNIQRNYPIGVYSGQIWVIVDTTVPGATPCTGPPLYFMSVKNSVAESHGVLGHYCVFSMQNYNTEKIELFTVEADVMKSYP